MFTRCRSRSAGEEIKVKQNRVGRESGEQEREREEDKEEGGWGGGVPILPVCINGGGMRRVENSWDLTGSVTWPHSKLKLDNNT